MSVAVLNDFTCSCTKAKITTWAFFESAVHSSQILRFCWIARFDSLFWWIARFESFQIRWKILAQLSTSVSMHHQHHQSVHRQSFQKHDLTIYKECRCQNGTKEIWNVYIWSRNSPWPNNSNFVENKVNWRVPPIPSNISWFIKYSSEFVWILIHPNCGMNEENMKIHTEFWFQIFNAYLIKFSQISFWICFSNILSIQNLKTGLKFKRMNEIWCVLFNCYDVQKVWSKWKSNGLLHLQQLVRKGTWRYMICRWLLVFFWVAAINFLFFISTKKNQLS